MISVFYFKKTPKIIQWLFPGFLWRGPERGKAVYLTFDDGPDPGSTVQILDYLASNDAKASFFCLGKQAEKYPELIEEIKQRGHALGHHGYQHLSGWTAATKIYQKDLEKGASLVASRLFRPPYGRIRIRQYLHVRSHYQIVLWSRMPGDFDPQRDKEAMKKEAQKRLSPGEIIVLHDRPDCLENTLYYLESLFEQNPGREFRTIE